MKPEILLETNDIIAVNKPSGLLTIPDRHDPNQSSLSQILKKKKEEIFVVHRLDKFTSGVILFAKNPEVHRFLSLQFENRQVRKEYTGIVTGKMNELSGTVEAPIEENRFRKGEMIVSKRGKSAITHFESLEVFNLFSVVRFMPVTGRTHQIRVHAQYINHPLACDPLYGDGKAVFLSSFKKKYNPGKQHQEERPLLNRVALHASSITFQDSSGNRISIEAPLPKDMHALIEQLKKNL